MYTVYVQNDCKPKRLRGVVMYIWMINDLNLSCKHRFVGIQSCGVDGDQYQSHAICVFPYTPGFGVESLIGRYDSAWFYHRLLNLLIVSDLKKP